MFPRKKCVKGRTAPSAGRPTEMADVERCQEAIANYVLDANEAVSCRYLASQVGGASATRAQAMRQFWQQNADGVGALQIVVEQGAALTMKQGSVDPRARVIRISVAEAASATAEAEVYGVYPCKKASADDQEAVTTAVWAQERKMRNDLFAKMAKNKPLTRELKAFYESDVECKEATSRTDLGNVQGEEAVSVFDSIRRTGSSTASAASAPKPSVSKGSSASTASSSTSSTSKGGSFFKSTAVASSTKSKEKPSIGSKAKAPTEQEVKRIDEKAMSNVLSVDSDDESDGDAPKFVKTAAATKPRTKRVMISDDEDEDEEEEQPPAKKPANNGRASSKAKVNEPVGSPTNAAKPAVESPKRRREVVEEPEPQAEDDTAVPTGPVKRRQMVTKTRINEQGYMVTEQVYEEVEVSAEELAKERAETAKKKEAAEKAAAAQKARAAQAASGNSGSKSGKAAGPAKQKKLDFFFARK